MSIRSLSGPIFVETFLRMLFMSIDVFMLQFLSGKAVAAMGPIMQFYFCIVVVMMVSTSGAGILIAQNLGAKRVERAAEISLVSLVLVFVFGLMVGYILYLKADLFLQFFELEEQVYQYAHDYMVVMGSGSLIISYSIGIAGIARSYGYPKVTLYSSIIGNSLNAFGNYCFIFGAFGVPVLGVKGVAMSTLAGNLLSGLVVSWFLWKRCGLKLPFSRCLRMPLGHYWSILKIGAPSAGEMLSYNLAQMTTMHFISRMGTTSLTAFVCAFNIMRFIFMFSLSIGQAVQILVGYLIGAGRVDEAYSRTLNGLWVSVCITFVVAVIYSIFRFPLLGIYTQDPEVLKMGGALILMTLLLEPSRAFNIVLGGALKGSGDYQFPVMIGIVSMWGISVGLSYFLGIRWGMGILGVWIAMTADEAIRAMIMLFRWNSKAWIKKSMIKS